MNRQQRRADFKKLKSSPMGKKLIKDGTVSRKGQPFISFRWSGRGKNRVVQLVLRAPANKNINTPTLTTLYKNHRTAERKRFLAECYKQGLTKQSAHLKWSQYAGLGQSYHKINQAKV